MTVVASDKRGLYVPAGDRCARPGPGQAQGLRAGSHVRAAVVSEGLRVRYGGAEQVWPLYVGRHTPPPEPKPLFQYSVGQTYRRVDGNLVRVSHVYDNGGMRSTGGGKYDQHGVNLAWREVPAKYIQGLQTPGESVGSST